MEIAIQVVLMVSVVLLTLIFVTVGVWVVLILREVKKAIGGIGKVEDELQSTVHLVRRKIRNGFNMLTVLASLGAVLAEKYNLGDFFLKIGKISRRNRVLKGKLIGKDKTEEAGTESKEIGASPFRKKQKFFFKKS